MSLIVAGRFTTFAAAESAARQLFARAAERGRVPLSTTQCDSRQLSASQRGAPQPTVTR